MSETQEAENEYHFIQWVECTGCGEVLVDDEDCEKCKPFMKYKVGDEKTRLERLAPQKLKENDKRLIIANHFCSSEICYYCKEGVKRWYRHRWEYTINNIPIPIEMSLKADKELCEDCWQEVVDAISKSPKNIGFIEEFLDLIYFAADSKLVLK